MKRNPRTAKGPSPSDRPATGTRTAGGEAGSDNHPAPQQREDGSDDSLAAAPDHDVPNEEVIEKTLPEPNRDKPRP